MRYLFDAPDEETETRIREMVNRMLSELQSYQPSEQVVAVMMSSEDAHIIANLLEIGTAPRKNDVIDMMRETADQNSYVRMSLSGYLARGMANTLEIGMIRHEAGIDHPKRFYLQ